MHASPLQTSRLPSASGGGELYLPRHRRVLLLTEPSLVMPSVEEKLDKGDYSQPQFQSRLKSSGAAQSAAGDLSLAAYKELKEKVHTLKNCQAESRQLQKGLQKVPTPAIRSACKDCLTS